MIRIGILGDIGSGKSYSPKFYYPVFDADKEVCLYKNKKIYNKLKKVLPKYSKNSYQKNLKCQTQ